MRLAFPPVGCLCGCFSLLTIAAAAKRVLELFLSDFHHGRSFRYLQHHWSGHGLPLHHCRNPGTGQKSRIPRTRGAGCGDQELQIGPRTSNSEVTHPYSYILIIKLAQPRYLALPLIANFISFQNKIFYYFLGLPRYVIEM